MHDYLDKRRVQWWSSLECFESQFHFVEEKCVNKIRTTQVCRNGISGYNNPKITLELDLEKV